MTGRNEDENKWSCHERKRNVQSGWRSRWRSLRARKRCAQVGQKMRGIILRRGWKFSRQYQRGTKNSFRWWGIGQLMRRGTENQETPRKVSNPIGWRATCSQGVLESAMGTVLPCHWTVDGMLWWWCEKCAEMRKAETIGCPRNEKKISVRTETNRNKICFAFVPVCFVKPTKKNFGLFRCFEPLSKQPKQTGLFQNEPKQSGIFWKIPKQKILSGSADLYTVTSITVQFNKLLFGFYTSNNCRCSKQHISLLLLWVFFRPLSCPRYLTVQYSP